MYLEHYGLTEFPFSLTPDTQFFAKFPQYVEALEVLKVSLKQGEGFIKIVGEVGTGKTLLCRYLIQELEKDFITAYIPNPQFTPTQLYAALAFELGIKVVKREGSLILKQITEQLIALRAQGKKAVLLLDEAQALPEDSLEALRLLTNIETEKAKLLQVVLFGQPELNKILKKPSLRQFAQRITFSYTLRPLEHKAVGFYLNHRLAVAGYNGLPIFKPMTVRILSKVTGGIPRLINILAHKMLMVSFGMGDRAIKLKHLKRAVLDTDALVPLSNYGFFMRPWVLLLMSTSVVFVLLGMLFHYVRMPP